MPAKNGDSNSYPSLGGQAEQNNRENHQNAGQGTQGARAGDAVTPATGDDAVGGRDGKGQAGTKANPGQGVEHASFLHRFGRSLANTQAILAVVGVGTLVVTMIQLQVIQRQLKQMRNQNKIAITAINASDKQAAEAEKANKIAGNALFSSERPWVYPIVTSDISIDQVVESAIDKKTTLRAHISIHNSGKTPANDLNVEAKIGGIWAAEWREASKNIKLIKYLQNQSAFPGAAIALPELTVSGGNFDQYDINKYSRQTLYLIINISYKDGAGKDHKTAQCLQYAASFQNFVGSSCPPGFQNAVN